MLRVCRLRELLDLSLRLLKLLDVFLVHRLELSALLPNACQLLRKALNLGLLLSIDGTNFRELRICLIEVLAERIRHQGVTFALFCLHLKHDLDAGGQVFIEQLPLIRIRRQQDLLINDKVFEGLHVEGLPCFLISHLVVTILLSTLV